MTKAASERPAHRPKGRARSAALLAGERGRDVVFDSSVEWQQGEQARDRHHGRTTRPPQTTEACRSLQEPAGA